MGTPRWQLREMQQQRFLEKLLREGDTKAEDEYYEFYRQLAVAILSELPRVSRLSGALFDGGARFTPGVEPNPVSNFWCSALEQIQKFSRTPQEIPYLAWKLSEAAFERASHSFTREYHSQAVMKPELIYGGNATDDAPEDEIQEALRD